tara:strand:+ start:263 stop:913 length:651 start_codon:yes stop_codon:yes gene_type:complete
MAKKTEYKVVSLMSGGIDSPVATALMLEKGLEVVFVHFDSRPFTCTGVIEKTRELVSILAKRYKFKPKFYVIPHSKVQTEILEKVNHKSLCVICRRMMYRIAEKIAEKEKAHALVTGENLGQVASQTLDNLAVEDDVVDIPVLRPLLSFDKNEAIDIAKKVNTYWVSILPGSCCKFTPKFPETHAEKKIIENMEKSLDIEKLVAEAVKSAKVEAIV